MTTNNADLYAALAKTRAEIGVAAHDAENTYHRYKYTSSEAVIDICSKALAENGISLLPVESDIVEEILSSKWLLCHSSGCAVPISRQMPVVPDKGRPKDKATCVALTVNLAYLLRDICGLKRPDSDDDINQRDDREHTPQKQNYRKKNDTQHAQSKPGYIESQPSYLDAMTKLIHDIQTATSMDQMPRLKARATQLKPEMTDQHKQDVKLALEAMVVRLDDVKI